MAGTHKHYVVGDRTMTGCRLGQLFNIDPMTGEVFWRVHKYRAKPGQIAGVVKPNGYRVIVVDQIKYRAHHLVWVWCTGKWPREEIDHINGNRDDNRIDNLREATVAQNRTNRIVQSNNKSGYKWVYWCKQSKKWRAEIAATAEMNMGRKRLYSSTHDTPEEAHKAACVAAKSIFGEWYNSGVKE